MTSTERALDWLLTRLDAEGPRRMAGSVIGIAVVTTVQRSGWIAGAGVLGLVAMAGFTAMAVGWRRR